MEDWSLWMTVSFGKLAEKSVTGKSAFGALCKKSAGEGLPVPPR